MNLTKSIRSAMSQKYIDNGEFGAIYRMFGDAMNRIALPVLLINTIINDYDLYFAQRLPFYLYIGIAGMLGGAWIVINHKYLYQSTVMDQNKQGIQRNPIYEKECIILEKQEEIIQLLKGKL